MTVDQMLKSMNDKADAMLRERERIIDFVEALQEGYMQAGQSERASACKAIIEQLRWKQ